VIRKHFETRAEVAVRRLHAETVAVIRRTLLRITIHEPRYT